jgi:hypothetical protein
MSVPVIRSFMYGDYRRVGWEGRVPEAALAFLSRYLSG